jgi:hypothetical protein
LILTFCLLSAVAFAGRQSLTPPEKLAADPRFRSFAYNFIDRYKQWAGFYKMPKQTKEEFIKQLELCDGEEESVAEVHSRFSLDFEESARLKNEVDNQLLGVISTFQELQDCDEEVAWKTISEAIGIVVRNPTEGDLEITRVLPPQEGLTVEEVWECMKEALGVGVGSILSIAALQKLAKEGIQKVVITVSKYLAKKAGWFGAILTLAEFSLCIKEAYSDDPSEQ